MTRISERISGDAPETPRYLGSGDYHYVSFLRMKQLHEPFGLVLLDQHPDDQPGAFDDRLLSCGNWVAAARRDIPRMRTDVWIQRFSDLSRARTTLSAFPQLPVFLSIDLDVLSPAEFRTDWDQGEMRFTELQETVRVLCGGRRLLGVDICGAAACREGGALTCELRQNASLLDRLEAFLEQFQKAASTR